MNHTSHRQRLSTVVMLALLATACQAAPSETEVAETPTSFQLLPDYATVTAEPTATPPEEAPPPSPTPSESLPTGIPLTRQLQLGDLSLELPNDWYWTQVTLDHLDSLLFLEQDPTGLAEFDDPNVALPVDFTAGALIVTAASEAIDPLEWQQGVLDSYADLTDGDFEAMLLAVDQIGLINFAAVDEARLVGVSLEELGGEFALMLEGVVFFTEDTPPVLHVAIWLTRIESRFVGYYAMASEDVWETSEAVFDTIGDTIQIR